MPTQLLLLSPRVKVTFSECKLHSDLEVHLCCREKIQQVRRWGEGGGYKFKWGGQDIKDMKEAQHDSYVHVGKNFPGSGNNLCKGSEAEWAGSIKGVTRRPGWMKGGKTKSERTLWAIGLGLWVGGRGSVLSREVTSYE